MPSKQDRILPYHFFRYRSFNLLVSLVLVIYLFKSIGKFSIFSVKVPSFALNNRFLRVRGMASTLKMDYQVFLCIFQNNSAMATLGLKEMGKFLWEDREKVLPCWLSQFSFPISFKPKVAIGVLLENAKKNLVFHFEGGRHASFPQKPVVKKLWKSQKTWTL